VLGDGLGGEGARSKRKQGIASVHGVRRLLLTLLLLLGNVGFAGLFASFFATLVGKYCGRGCGRDEGC
jgi:hypothetical protein